MIICAHKSDSFETRKTGLENRIEKLLGRDNKTIFVVPSLGMTLNIVTIVFK
jgi:hypothetical protein